ncbi:hypothetical protein BGY98DRAFT_95476 [Russula aff. rugulosa BPL654]|nr:hypothetical protein BGY98DRAFT_95476 [Russula aff. rugulosa BPL654]
MVNFHDPVVIARESDKIDKFWSFVGGIFIWEFLITLDYEWSVIRGHRPYRWTIWVYSLTRVATLAAVALNMYSIDATAPINCQVTSDLQFIFAYLAFATSSLLMVLRIIAIWNRKTIIVALATGVWGVNIAFLIQGKSLPPCVGVIKSPVQMWCGIRCYTVPLFVGRNQRLRWLCVLPGQHQTQLDCRIRCRHHLASHHAFWSAPPAPTWW